jgi:hypothetical protein
MFLPVGDARRGAPGGCGGGVRAAHLSVISYRQVFLSFLVPCAAVYSLVHTRCAPPSCTTFRGIYLQRPVVARDDGGLPSKRLKRCAPEGWGVGVGGGWVRGLLPSIFRTCGSRDGRVLPRARRRPGRVDGLRPPGPAQPASCRTGAPPLPAARDLGAAASGREVDWGRALPSRGRLPYAAHAEDPRRWGARQADSALGGRPSAVEKLGAPATSPRGYSQPTQTRAMRWRWICRPRR